VTVALLAAGASAVGSTLPAAEDLPANMVAVVSDVPVGVGRLTKTEFRRALVQRAAAAGRDSVPQPGGNGYGKLRDAAVAELLDIAWIKGQAAEMGIAVTRRQIATELAQIKKDNFKSEAQYRRFLKQSHFTRRDVDERVELQLLSTRIQERVLRGVRGPRASQKALQEFVDAYMKRWRARTVCAPEYATERCLNGPLPAG
jgi:parvulin-like peptidyl-prolyl isomerase